MNYYLNKKKKILKKILPLSAFYFISKDFSSTKDKKIIKIFDEAKEGINIIGNLYVLKKGKTGLIIKVKEKEEIKRLEDFNFFIFDIFEEIRRYYIHKEINELTESLKYINDFNDIYNILVKKLCEILDFEKGVFCRYDPDENLIYAFPPGYGVKNESDILFFCFKLDEPSAGSIAISRQDIYITNDAINDPYIIKKFVPYFNAYKVMIVPFFYKEKLVGLFYGARGKNSRDIDDEDIFVMKILSSYISLVINYLLENENRIYKEESLIELTKTNTLLSKEIDFDKVLLLIDDALLRLFKCDGVSLMLFSEERNGFYIKSALGLSEEYINKQFLPFENVKKSLDEGITVLAAEDIRKQPYGDIELIKKEGIISVLSSIIFIEDKPFGILNVYQRKLKKFTEDDIFIIEAFAAQVGVTLRNSQLYDKIIQTTESFVFALSEMESLKDLYTLSHSENVATFALKIGMAMGLPQNILDDIYRAGLLHDVGKLIVEKELLVKPGKLTDEELEEMKKHVEYGKNILERIKDLENITEYIYYHHERYDGNGYPRGLKDDEIPIGARILAVADAVEAMLSNRPYRKRLSIEEIKNELNKEKGAQFDPNIVDIALKIIES